SRQPPVQQFGLAVWLLHVTRRPEGSIPAQPRAKQRGRRSRSRCDALGYGTGLDLGALKGRA
ncbi:MAG: hypothetical protein ACKO0N_16845, partial [Planctomycetota bacterium]